MFPTFWKIFHLNFFRISQEAGAFSFFTYYLTHKTNMILAITQISGSPIMYISTKTQVLFLDLQHLCHFQNDFLQMTHRSVFFEFFFLYSKPPKCVFYVTVLPINLFGDSKRLSKIFSESKMPNSVRNCHLNSTRAIRQKLSSKRALKYPKWVKIKIHVGRINAIDQPTGPQTRLFPKCLAPG